MKIKEKIRIIMILKGYRIDRINDGIRFIQKDIKCNFQIFKHDIWDHALNIVGYHICIHCYMAHYNKRHKNDK